jgi:hypothetical protein
VRPGAIVKSGTDIVADSAAKRQPAVGVDALPADVFAPGAVAFDPISVPEPAYVGIAYELNGLAGDPDDWPVRTESIPGAHAEGDEIGYVLSDDLELALLGELARTVEKTAQGATPNPADALENAGPLVADPAFLCGVQADDVEDVIAAAATSPQVQANEEAAPLPQACFDVEAEFVCEPETVTVERAVAPTPKRVAELPWPAFTPSQSADQPNTEVDAAVLAAQRIGGSGPADADSTASDQNSACKSQATLGSSAADALEHGGLNQAVELTRNAAFAWMRVFTGPALVRVSAR